MPTVAVYDIANNQVGDIELNENIFGVEMNAGLVHQAVVMQLASQRLGTHATKTRGMVRLGSRRVPVVHAVVPPVPQSGLAVVPYLDHLLVPTRSACLVSSVALQSCAHCLIR